MLSEMAIDDKKAFANLVKLAKDALEGKMPKEAKVEKAAKTEVKEEKKETVKKETKAPAKKEAKEDLSTKTVAELKEMAKKKKIEGYTSMKKADLIKALK